MKSWRERGNSKSKPSTTINSPTVLNPNDINSKNQYANSNIHAFHSNMSTTQTDEMSSSTSTTMTMEVNAYDQSTQIYSNYGVSMYLNNTENWVLDEITPFCAQHQCNSLNLNLKGKGMHIGHLNVRGIRSKFDDVNLMLQSNENDIAILGLSESKLGPNQPESAFHIPDFQVFRKDKTEGSGGLLTYVKDDITCIRRYSLESPNIESIWLEIFPKHSKSFLVGYIYRNPNSKVSWNEDFEAHIENILDDQKETLMLGDFNKDLFNVQIKNNWTEYMSSIGFTQHVQEATRVVEGKSSTLIDHIYSSHASNLQFIDVPKIGLSDHYPVFLTRKIHLTDPKYSHHTIHYRSFKNFNEDEFKADLMQEHWDAITVFEDVDDAMDSWYSLFNKVIDKHLPIKQHRVKRHTQPKWLSSEIIDAIKMRDKLKAQGKETEYKTARNIVNKLIKSAKKTNYEKIVEHSNNNPRNVWKVFKEFGAGKKCNDGKNSIPSIIHKNERIFDNQVMANVFNDFFISVARNLKEDIEEETSHEKLFDFCRNKLDISDIFEIPPISKEKVIRYLSFIDISKATGNDSIGPKILRISAPFIAESITHLCNLSIHSGKVPSKWKEAKVKPLFKSGSRDNVNNYRPISILPTLSKLIEKHVHDSLMTYLGNHDLICKNQSGFRPKHSCETALINIVEKWLKAMNEGKLVGVIMVDFRKAFDLVDHHILLRKLKAYQLNASSMSWFQSYLNDRKQQVQIDNNFSNFEAITCGVPQGSILGPLLFLLFINDLPLCTNTVITDMYADDTTLYDMNKSQQVIENNLSTALIELSIWCRQNGMVINFEKTKAMLITTRQKRDQLEIKSLNIKVNTCCDKYVNIVSCDKLLGVQIDENLSWAEHIKSVTLKMTRNIWLLSQISKYLSISHRITFYKSFIQPHIDYCNIVWSNCPKTCLAKIERLQKRACKIILDYEYEDIMQSMNDMNIMTINERIFLRKAKFMYKTSNNMCPLYINEIFNRRPSDDVTVPVLRSTTNNHYLLPQPKTELYRNSLAFTGPIIWNCLPQHIKNVSSIEAFQRSCIQWMKHGNQIDS